MNKLIKGLGFETIEDYYNYIVESLINGQRGQVRSLFNQMPSENKKEFMGTLEQGELMRICMEELVC